VLESGLELQSGEILPWGATAKELLSIGNPQHIAKNTRYDIWWPEQILLQGLSASVKITLQTNQRAFEFEIHCRQTSDIDAQDTYQRVATHLDKIGNRSSREGSIKIEPLGNTLSGSWDIGQTIAEMYLFDRFGWICDLRIKTRLGT